MSHVSSVTNVARLVLVALACAVLAISSASMAAAQDANLQAEGQKAVQAWVDAVVSGDVGRIEAILAPHFQILRADGTAYDKRSYLASDLPSFPHVPEISDLVVTRDGDILVARYMLTTGGVREGVERPMAPRLTVFQKDGDRWLVVAHANFAAIER